MVGWAVVFIWGGGRSRWCRPPRSRTRAPLAQRSPARNGDEALAAVRYVPRQGSVRHNIRRSYVSPLRHEWNYRQIRFIFRMSAYCSIWYDQKSICTHVTRTRAADAESNAFLPIVWLGDRVLSPAKSVAHGSAY